MDGGAVEAPAPALASESPFWEDAGGPAVAAQSLM